MENPPIDMIDKLLAIGIILLILSLITEKITQFIRKYFRHASEIRYINFFFRKSPSEKTREKELMYVSISVGVVVAWLSNASILNIFKTQDPTTVLFNDPFGVSFDIVRGIGFFLTGVFLSLGSKFFHDLLEMLFQIKRLKQKLTEEKTYSIQSIKEFDEYVQMTENEMINLAIKENKEMIMSLPNVRNLHMGVNVIKGINVQCAFIHLKNQDRQGIPDSLYAHLASGRSIKVPVQIIENVDIPAVQVSPGAMLAHNESRDFVGTYGCVLKYLTGDNKYILTCSHVLTNGTSESKDGRIPINEREDVVQIINPSSLEKIGRWFYGLRNSQFDLALIEIEQNRLTLDNTINGTQLSSARKVTDVDVFNKIKVSLVGAISKKQDGIILYRKLSNPLKYNDNTIITLDNLLLITRKLSNNRYQALTTKGDSGAVIFDEKTNEALGMVVAGNKQFTYAIPMDSILGHLGMKLA